MILRRLYLAWLRGRLRRFLDDARRARDFQHRALLEKIRRNADSDFGRDFGFSSIRTAADFRRRMPILTYEDHHAYVQRVLHGDESALFAPGTRVLMFAMSSGTTAEPKRLPITVELFREYCRGWRLWGAGVYGDHSKLHGMQTLQLSSDWRQRVAPCGKPCGQISGLAATTRPRIARRMFLPPSEVSMILDPAEKHYAILRFALASRRVGMVITANPSTLVEFARLMGRRCESLVRDIYDGTLSCAAPAAARAALGRRIAARAPDRARELARLAERHGGLTPKLAWPKLSVIAVWTGGSVGVFLPQLADLYGQAAVRDHGLSASEGRTTIPLADGTSAGILDFYHHYFEFIPAEEHEAAYPTVLEGHELEVGRDYFVVMTTSGGLYRYDIHDVVRCVGFEGKAPLLEFLNKGKSFSNLTGEKLSEHQVVRAVEQSFRELDLPIELFTLAPTMDAQPRYMLMLEQRFDQEQMKRLADRVQANLVRLNEEYAAKCASGRLMPIEICEAPPGAWDALRHESTHGRGNFEQYKHPCLVEDLTFVERIVRDRRDVTIPLPAVSWEGREPAATDAPAARAS
jgi:hypothetical protein